MISKLTNIVESPWFPSLGGFIEFCAFCTCIAIFFVVVRLLFRRDILLISIVVIVAISLIILAIAAPVSAAISLPTLLAIIYAMKMDAKRKEEEKKKWDEIERQSREYLNSSRF